MDLAETHAVALQIEDINTTNCITINQIKMLVFGERGNWKNLSEH